MGVVSHSHHRLSRNGGSWKRASWAQPGGDGHTAEYARALPVCEVGTLLTHHGTEAVLNLCVTEKSSAWQCAVTGDGRRRRCAAALPRNRRGLEYPFAIGLSDCRFYGSAVGRSSRRGCFVTAY